MNEPDGNGTDLDRKKKSKVQVVEDAGEWQPAEEAVEEELEWGEEAAWEEVTAVDLMRAVIKQAWQDGKITSDEMDLLRVIKEKLEVDEVSFNDILQESRPEEVLVGPVPEDEIAPTEEPQPLEPIEVPPPPKPPEMEAPKPKEENAVLAMSTLGRPTDLITLTRSARTGTPLAHSFDLSQRPDDGGKRCPNCRAFIDVHIGGTGGRCPVCGVLMEQDQTGSHGLRKILDMAKEAYKAGNRPLAMELYSTALKTSPENKEALFYIQKLSHRTERKETIPRADLSSVAVIPTEVQKLDTLLKGGIETGGQVLVKGPAFCGKEMLLDSLLSSSLKKGFPVIYISTTRAMGEVMRGIVQRMPEFREYNKEGRVRIFDLFSKHSDDMVLRDGHRIFNIEVKEDLQRFEEDLISVLDELAKNFKGGVMIINSLTPLINHADLNELMRFLKVLIAKSKGFKFTNIYDMAAAVHPENVVNSVEYVMDGIIEFREKESKYSLRLKGFRQGVVSKDWIDYSISESSLNICGPFHEERIL